MDTDPNCIFCRIIAGELPASIVTEDEAVIAFMDINPATPGHLLVVPKEHHEGIATIPGETMSHMMLVAQWLSAALRSADIRTEGINLYLADGSAAGQEVMHAHLHIIPRWQGDGFKIRARRGRPPTRDELTAQAAQIRDASVD